MKKKYMATAILMMGTLLSSSAYAKSNAKEYCGGDGYYGNAGSKAPHLHCQGDMISFKKANGDHFNILQNSNKVACTRAQSALEYTNGNTGLFTNINAVLTPLNSIIGNVC